MSELRMVPLVRVSHGFEARVLAAKLGSEGIVTQFRGAVEGPYPVGAVDVLVTEDDVAEAREILGAELVDLHADQPEWPVDAPTDQRRRTPVVVVTLGFVLLALALATAFGAGLSR